MEAPSPAPSCTSLKSDQSMDRPIHFRDGMKMEAPTPALSCTSLKSDQTMDRPIHFRDGEMLASLLTEDDFKCSVCKDVLKEPVSIPCGHSYCKTCIQTYWSNPTHAGSYCCPQCRKRFRTRPQLIINSSLDKVIQKLQQAGFSPALPPRCYAGPADVACDFCTERKLKAVKSCLTCSASYCENHVKQHYTVAALQRHTLVEVTGDLEQRLCKLHQRALEVFCKTDETYICLICAMDKHKEHETILTKTDVPALQMNTPEDLRGVSFDSVSQMEKEIKHLIKENNALTEKVENLQRSDIELAKQFSRGLEKADGLTSDFVEVSALGRSLDLGMLYDCYSDSFSSDALLWDEDTLSSMKLSLPRVHTAVEIFESEALQDRLRALDLTPPLRAGVVSGLVEVSGAAAFLNHPVQSQLQDRVTLHYRTSTRLDMLSLRLLLNGAPLSGTKHNTATHVVAAVLYGAKAYFVFDDKKQISKGSDSLKDVIKRNFISQSAVDLFIDSEVKYAFECSVYSDVEDYKNPLNFDAAVKVYSSLQHLLGSQGEKAVPLKVWLFPLNGVRQMSALIVNDINEDILDKAIDVLEQLNRNKSITQDMMSIYSDLGVIKWFPALKEALFEFSSLMQLYQRKFRTGLASSIKNMKKKETQGEESLRNQTALASCIKTMRERVDKEEENLRVLLKRNDQSPFSPQNLHQWLLNKDAEVVALNECRAAKVTVVKSSQILEQVIQKSDTVFCFTLTSLESKDPFLLSLREHINLWNGQERKSPFRLSDISQKIQSDLRSFLSCRETNADAEHTKFIAASIPEPQFSGSSIYLYLNGNIVSCNVRLDVKPEIPEIIMTGPKSVVVRLQRSGSNVLNRHRVECRAVNCRGSNLSDNKWKENSVSYPGEYCKVLDLTPETQYQLRFALMDSSSMSDYSKIIEFQTAPRARPGQPAVKQLNKDFLHVVWNRPETDEDSPVLRYMVEFMEAGLEGWQSILTQGPECECTITLPYSTCYRVRVSAVYGDRDTSEPSQETEVSVDIWYIDLSERKASVFTKVLKLQLVKKPVELRDWSDEESEVCSFLQCLSHISQLRFITDYKRKEDVIKLLLKMFITAAECDAALGESFTEQLQSVWCYDSFPFDENDEEYDLFEQCDVLLDLYSHVKQHETETSTSVLPALQPVYQSAPEVWYIKLSERKASILLEVLKLQTVKKPVKLRDWSDEESEVRSFLQCLPYISQLRFHCLVLTGEEQKSAMMFLKKLYVAAAECDAASGESFINLVLSVSSYEDFPFYGDPDTQCDFLLDLYSHVKQHETETSRSVLPALQPVYQSAPAVWYIKLSERKASVLLEVLKLQTEKKPVKLLNCTDEESEVRSFLQCLPYISQLRFITDCKRKEDVIKFLLKMFITAAECDAATGESFTERLQSVCRYDSFPFDEDDEEYYLFEQCDFLLDLYSHVKLYETETGRSVLPALQPVYQSAPAVWNIYLSDGKASILLEVLKLQTVKKPVELLNWPDEESEVRSFLQCLPHISQLRLIGDSFDDEEHKTSALRFLKKLFITAAKCDAATGESFTEQLVSVWSCETFPFVEVYNEKYDPVALCDFLLDLYSRVKLYETKTSKSVLPALQPVYQSAPAVWTIKLSERKLFLFLEVLKLQTVKKPVELRSWSDKQSVVRIFLQCLPHISHLSVSGNILVRMLRALRRGRSPAPAPVSIEQLSLVLNTTKQAEGALSRVLSSLAYLLRLWNIQCLNLTECKIEAHSLTVLLCHQGPLTIRLSKKTLQQLAVLVYEAQQEELTQSFLQKVGGNFSSCSMKWEMIQYFLQYHTVTADFRKSNVTQQNIRELVLVLDKIHFRRLTPSMVLCIMREIHETGSAHCVSSLLSSVENCINLNRRELDSGHCAALCFILQHCTAVSLNLLWASIPEGELERIVPLLEHVSRLSVDRLLLLRLLHCCSVSELHLESAATLLSALQQKLDFSCSSALDLTTDTETNTLLLRTETCKVISTVIQRANQHTQLNLHDCEIEEAGVEELITILHTVTLNCSKALLLQFLTRVRVGSELECVRRAVNLSKALGGEVDLSHTQLDLQACTSLALLLEHCEGLAELDLSHCQLTDHCLELLLPHLHKCHILDFSHNDITDVSAKGIYDVVSTNSSIQTVWLFNNRIKDRKVFRADQHFEIW